MIAWRSLTIFRLLARALSASVMFGGCAAPPDPIPRYPTMTPEASMELIRERARRIGDISAEGAVTLRDAGGATARLEAVFVFSPPDRARVRAWKFGNAVLDLTVAGDEVWLFFPQRDQSDTTDERAHRRAEATRRACANAAEALREWLGALAGSSRGERDTLRSTGHQIIVERPTSAPAGMIAELVFDRPTLTLRQYSLRDSSAEPGRQETARVALDLSRYVPLSEAAGEFVWPTRIEAFATDGESVLVEMHDIQVGQVSPSAFTPPARAERVR